MTEIQERLSTPVPAAAVSKRSGLSYITGAYVKRELNNIFGFEAWSYEVLESKLLYMDEKTVRWYVHGQLTVRVRVNGEKVTVIKDGIAIGHGTLGKMVEQDDGSDLFVPTSAGRTNEVVDFAAAEAVTDSLKRAAVSLGEALGLSLYPMVAGKPNASPAGGAPRRTLKKRGTKS